MSTQTSTIQLPLEQFQDQGFMILRDALDARIVESAREAMKELVNQAADRLIALGRITDPLTGDPFETRLYHLYKNNLDLAPKSYRQELHKPGLFDVFFNPTVLDFAQQILGPEIRLYPNYTARPKLPDWEGTLVLWHQDGGYTESTAEGSPDSLRMVNVWSPLVRATRANGCMQFVPGTHKLGVVRHVTKKHYLEIAPEVLDPLLSSAIDIELNPGDVVLFHNLLFHRGLPNLSKSVRWSLDWRYQDATQPTLRKQSGHLARSSRNLTNVVATAADWATLSFT